MIVVHGKAVQSGLSVGPIRFLSREEAQTRRQSPLTPGEELYRFEAAKERAIAELNRLQARVAAHVGESEAAIFRFQSMILEDGEYLKAIRTHIREAATAEYAVSEAGKVVVDFFSSMDDSYMRARAADAMDLSRRLEGILTGQADWREARQRSAILVSHDLTPSETALLDTGKLMGLVSRQGSPESHTTILARAIGVPALVGVEVDPAWEGHMAVLDGDEGTLIIDPDPETLRSAQARLWRVTDPKAWQELNLPCQTRDGRAVRLCASVASAWEAADAYARGASGIGLYYSQVLYLGRSIPPTEEEQLGEYRRVIQAMCGRLVTIRTLDLEGEDGHRDLRACLERPDLFRPQLRAILRASAHGPTAVAFPGVISVKELRRARQVVDQCQQELDREGREYSPLQVGAVIQTPAAVRLAEELAQEVDFLSLDARELLQCTVIGEGEAARPDYPALWWMLRRTADAGRRHRCRMTLCGDLEAYAQAIQPLLDLGVDEFSVPPGSLIYLRQLIQKLDKPKEA